MRRAADGGSAGRPARGATLLEVMVALTILGVAGVSALAMVVESAGAVARTRETEASLRRASAFLEVVTLWTRDDLDRRLGDRPQGPWRLRIERVAPTLYVAVLSDSGATGRELLRTSLFRPAQTNATRLDAQQAVSNMAVEGGRDAAP